MEVKKQEVPSLYWRLYKALEKHELDDGSLARSFRINKRDARKAIKEIKEYKEKKEMEKGLEYWFGKKPNGEKKNSIK